MSLLRRAVVSATVAAATACAASADADGTPGNIVVASHIVAPRAILERAAHVTIEVHNIRSAGICNADTGAVPELSNAGRITAQELLKGGCGGDPQALCASVSIPQGPTLRLFRMTATDGTDALIAQGCAETVVDHDYESVLIRLTATP